MVSLRALRQLRLASIFEGMTLLALLGIAVPLKHLGGLPTAVSIVGPVHGFAFLIYLWLTIDVAVGARWETRDVVRLLSAALVPFGFIFTARFIRRQRKAAVGAGG